MKLLIKIVLMSLVCSALSYAQKGNEPFKNIQPGTSEQVSDDSGADLVNQQKGNTNVYVNTGNQNLRQPCTIKYNTMAQTIVNQSVNYVTVAVNASMPKSQEYAIQAKAMDKLQKNFPDAMWQPITLKQNGPCEYAGSVCDFTFLVKARLDNEQMQKLVNQSKITPASDQTPTLNDFNMQYSIENANNRPDPNFTNKIQMELKNKILANITKQIKKVNNMLDSDYELQKVRYFPIQYDANKDRLSQQITMGAQYIIARNCKAGEVVRENQ